MFGMKLFFMWHPPPPKKSYNNGDVDAMDRNYSRFHWFSNELENWMERQAHRRKSDNMIEKEELCKETSCGAFGWRPKWIRASPKLWMFIYGLLVLLQGMLFSYLHAIISTVESQFGINSRQSSFLVAGKLHWSFHWRNTVNVTGETLVLN